MFLVPGLSLGTGLLAASLALLRVWLQPSTSTRWQRLGDQKTHSAGQGSAYAMLRTQAAAQACQQQCGAGQRRDQGHWDRTPSHWEAMLGRWLAHARSWGLCPLSTGSHQTCLNPQIDLSVLEKTPPLRNWKRNPESSQQPFH